MKVGIYCRLSEEDRNKQTKTDDSESIRNQKSMLLQYALDRGWEVYGIYSDDDYTGSDRNRPEFNRLLRDAERGRIDIVLCKTQSRFTREMELVEKYLHGLFPVWGVRFVSVVDNADTDNKGNKKARQINGLVNEWYLEEMSDNIRSVLTNRRKQGLHIGAFSLYGYNKDPERKGRLIVDPEAAEVVRKIFRLYAEGYGKTAVARILNMEGILSPSEYRRSKIVPGASVRSSPALWRDYTISAMLRNEMYIGTMVQGKYGSASYKTKRNRPLPKSRWIRVEKTHAPIVDDELWDRVQKRLSLNTRPLSKSGKTGLFAGKVCCSECGCVMRSTTTKGRRYLKCATAYAKKDACRGAFLSERFLETAVISRLNELLADYFDADLLDLGVNLPDADTAMIAVLQKELSVCEKKRDEYAKAIRELYLDKANGRITADTFAEMSDSFLEIKNHLDGLIAGKRERMAGLSANHAGPEDKDKIIGGFARIAELSRIMVDEWIDCVRVAPRDPETGERQIEICWSF